MENVPAVPETKAADVAGAFDEFKRSFESFKESNNNRIAAIGRAGNISRPTASRQA